MTVQAINPLSPGPRPAPERASRAQEDRDFARALDESGRREEPSQEERLKSVESEQPPEQAMVLQVEASASDAPISATPLSVATVETPSPQVDGASSPVATVAVSGSGAAAPPAEAANVAPLAQQADATPAAGAVNAAPESPRAGAQGEGGSERAERPFSERAEAGAEVHLATWTAPAVAGQTPAKPLVPPSGGESLAMTNGGDVLSAVKLLRRAALESLSPEPRAGAAPAPSPLPGLPPSAATAAPADSFEVRLQSAEAAAPAPSTATPRQAMAAAPAAQVAIHIARAVEDGVRRLEVRLNPAELGKVAVKLDLAQDGRVIAVVSAERQETLDLLQRDARSLERALQDAGIRADSGSLNFTLRQQDRQAWRDDGRPQGSPGFAERDFAAADAAAAAALRPRSGLRALDISV